MDIGTGIATAVPLSVSLTIAGIGVLRMLPTRKSKEKQPPVANAVIVCGEHGTTCRQIKALGKLSLAIAEHVKVPLDAIREEIEELMK
jgi:hypothetical protein